MSSKEAKERCGIGCLISTAISVIFICLDFRFLNPTCYIKEFDVFALTKPTNNHTMHYDLKLKNRNFNKGINYENLNLAIYYYKSKRNVVHIGNDTIAPFYQGYWKSTHRVGDVSSKGVHLVVPTNGEAVFRVELTAGMKYKSPSWKTKRHSLVIGADLKVNGHGSLIKDKGKNEIKLSSVANNRSGCLQMIGILIVLVFISI